ncbi:MAG TPA: hypothetical protein VF363_05335 [Candidatus Eisenbacteria bacterium]
MKRNLNSTAPRTLARHAPEVYCRRDNRVYESCPHADDPAACPCLMGVETADSLFDPKSDEGKSIQ